MKKEKEIIMGILVYIIVVIVGYFMGCIQSAYIIGRFSKIDIREHGSKNAGASNAFMILGWKKGLLVGVIDILKAAIPVFIVNMLFPENRLLALLCGLAVVIGHVFPVFLKFRGGKGTASIVGTMLGLHPILFVVAGLVIVIVSFISNYMAVGTLAMLISILVTMYLLNFDMISIGLFFVITLLSISKHMENFIKIKNGNESKLRSVIKKQAKQ